MRALITGAGNMGRAIRAALEARGDEVVAMVGRAHAAPGAGRRSAPVDVAFEFSHATALLDNVELGARRRLPRASSSARPAGPPTDEHRPAPDADARRRPMRAPWWRPRSASPPSCSASSPRQAARLFGRFPEYDPYVFEQHRRTKPDRPSGTAAGHRRTAPAAPARPSAGRAWPSGPGAPDPDVLEIVALRAGSHPGMHIVGFDGPGRGARAAHHGT